jgi:hypothetical protein
MTSVLKCFEHGLIEVIDFEGIKSKPAQKEIKSPPPRQRYVLNSHQCPRGVSWEMSAQLSSFFYQIGWTRVGIGLIGMSQSGKLAKESGLSKT